MKVSFGAKLFCRQQEAEHVHQNRFLLISHKIPWAFIKKSFSAKLFYLKCRNYDL